MFSSGIRQKQGIQIPFALILTAVFVGSFVLISPSDGFAVSALRSRVYGFRNTDNKQAVQLAGQLGIKVTIDTHSSSVVVLTGDDPLELTRAYSLMEITDRKEPVSMKVLGSVPDSKAEETVKQLHDQLKNLNLGTLLDPPAKVVANPSIVDVYQGELIAIASAAEMEKIEKAYKAWHDKQKSQRPKTSEPNTANPIQLSSSKSVEPNAPASQSPAAEPNTPQPAPTPAPQPIKQTSTEPNKPALQEQPAPQPAAAPTQQKAIEPNQAKPEEPQTQEDFMSNELLKTLASEEIKTQRDKTTPSMDKPALPGTAKTGMAEAPVHMPKTKTADATDTNTIQPPTQEITDAEFKKIVEQLMKQSQEEEKKAQGEQTPSTSSGQATAREQKALQEQAGEAKEKKAEQTPASSGQAVAAAPSPIQKSQQLETKAEKPVEPQIESKPEKTAKTETAPKTKTESEPSAAEPAIPKGEEELELTITLPEKVEIKQLIELVGKQLGLNYMYDENKVRGDVMLKIYEGKIKVKDCYALLESVLRYKGFVMTRRGSLVTIVPSSEVNASDPKIHIGGQQIEAGDVIVNGVFTLRYVNSNNAQSILRSLSLGTNIIPVAETNTLIITDYSYRMSKIEEVLRIIDVPGAAKIFTHRPLQYMQASVLIPRLQTLAAQLGNLSITVGTSASSAAVPSAPVRIDPRTGRPIPGGAAPVPAPSPAATSQEAVYLDADERTNRVLMIGTEEQLKVVNGLIDSLDIRQYNLRYVKEYEIKYVDASEVIDVLNELGLARVTPTTAKSSGQTTQPTGAQPQRSAMARPGMPQPAVSRQAAGTTEGTDEPFISIRPNTNSLLVNATGEQHEDIALVIKHIDVEQKDQRTIEEYEIQNVDAMEIVQTLGDLAIISKQSVSNITSSKGSMYGSSSGSGFGTTRTSGMMNQATGMPMDQSISEQSAIMSLPTAEGGTVRELITTEPQISILESTNSLLIYATPRQHASVALVIAHVDREVDRATAPYVVYPLENQDPEELAGTLTELIEGTMKKAAAGMPSSPGAKIQTEMAPTANLPKKEEEIIRIIPDKKSNALVVYANKKNQQWVATLIKELDQYRPQVLLDCTLVKITQDEKFTYDLDIIGKTYGGATMRGMTTGNPTAVPPVLPAAIVGSKTNFAQDSFIDARSTSGTGKVFFNSDRIQALLDIVESKGYGRVMSRPKILVNDNEEGSIKTKNTIPIAEVKVITTPYTTGTGTSATTSNDVQFKDYEAGVELKIKPHISKGDMLRLEITLNKTLFKLNPDVNLTINGSPNKYPSPPDRVSTDVISVATVPDGSTIVLGGLEEIDQTKDTSKVPILGDLPIVGGLFRKINNKGEQDRLYVFVKANVIRPSDQIEGLKDIKRVSDKYRKSFEEMEQKFQKMQSWPGIKAKPMDPTGVLEGDESAEELKKRSESEQPSVTVETPAVTEETQ